MVTGFRGPFYFGILRNVRLARTFLGLPADGFGLPQD
jgi:hypothetical protein